MNRPDLNKAISIKQPWAYLICAGIKDVENRTWPTKYIGRVYIHASANNACSLDELNLEQFDKILNLSVGNINHFALDNYNYSAIIGHVDIVNCISKARNGKGSDSIWAEPDCFHWILRNPVLFDKPILNVKGKLSFWGCSEYL